eukprot:7790806-Lingulodinium_polyedra.AAC.1
MAIGGKRLPEQHSRSPQSLGPKAQLRQRPPLERIISGVPCHAVSGVQMGASDQRPIALPQH